MKASRLSGQDCERIVTDPEAHDAKVIAKGSVPADLSDVAVILDRPEKPRFAVFHGSRYLLAQAGDYFARRLSTENGFKVDAPAVLHLEDVPYRAAKALLRSAHVPPKLDVAAMAEVAHLGALLDLTTLVLSPAHTVNAILHEESKLAMKQPVARLLAHADRLNCPSAPLLMAVVARGAWRRLTAVLDDPQLTELPAPLFQVFLGETRRCDVPLLDAWRVTRRWATRDAELNRDILLRPIDAASNGRIANTVLRSLPFENLPHSYDALRSFFQEMKGLLPEAALVELTGYVFARHQNLSTVDTLWGCARPSAAYDDELSLIDWATLDGLSALNRLRKRVSCVLVGPRVRRGPDWKWGNQDNGGVGSVIGGNKRYPMWIDVHWEKSYKSHTYRIGAQGAYDLVYA